MNQRANCTITNKFPLIKKITLCGTEFVGTDFYGQSRQRHNHQAVQQEHCTNQSALWDSSRALH